MIVSASAATTPHPKGPYPLGASNRQAQQDACHSAEVTAISVSRGLPTGRADSVPVAVCPGPGGGKSRHASSTQSRRSTSSFKLKDFLSHAALQCHLAGTAGQRSDLHASKHSVRKRVRPRSSRNLVSSALPVAELVPGDVVTLASGDEGPADQRLLALAAVVGASILPVISLRKAVRRRYGSARTRPPRCAT